MLKAARAWALTHTSKRRYSPVGIAFHWGMALVIAGMLVIGWAMGQLDPGSAKLSAFELHMALGLITLGLSLLRLVWRILISGPVNDADNLGWQTLLAKLTHVVFYICFVGLPVSGWLTWSAFAESERLNLGFISIAPFPLESLPFATKALVLYWADTTHHVLIWLLLLVIPAHIGAALKHHFWDQHDVLVGMLPVLAPEEPAASSKRKRKFRKSPGALKAG
jgi:cytochrome b561